MLPSPRRHATKYYVADLVRACTAQRPPTDDDVPSEDLGGGVVIRQSTDVVRDDGSSD